MRQSEEFDMVKIDRQDLGNGEILTRYHGDPVIGATLKPRLDSPRWHCPCCGKDKTLSFSYRLKRNCDWWCEDCVREAGLVW